MFFGTAAHRHKSAGPVNACLQLMEPTAHKICLHGEVSGASLRAKPWCESIGNVSMHRQHAAQLSARISHAHAFSLTVDACLHSSLRASSGHPELSDTHASHTSGKESSSPQTRSRKHAPHACGASATRNVHLREALIDLLLRRAHACRK